MVDIDCDPEVPSEQQMVEHSDEYAAEAAEQDGYDHQQSYQQQDMAYEEQMGQMGDTNQGNLF